MEHTPDQYDVAIVGAGYGGFLSALLLHTRGLRVIVLEKDTATGEKLGEAFTPELGTLIRLLGDAYDLPELTHLSNYTGVKRHHGDIPAFPKKYFHFAFLERNEEFLNESARWPLPADLHVSRRSYDGALGRLVEQRKIRIEYGAALDIPKREGESWQLSFADKSLKARFILDASGPGTYLAKTLGLQITPVARLSTALCFAHVRHAVAWPTRFPRAENTEGKIHGTGHYVFDRGWMWFIPFGNGVTSIGIHSRTDGPYAGQPALALDDLARMNPAFAQMFERAEPVFGWRSLAAVQYRARCAAGDGFAMLPASTYGLDALLSSGLVTTTNAIRRLVPVIVSGLKANTLQVSHFAGYERHIFHEAELLDLYVHALYISFPDPRLFDMLYSLFRFGTFLAGTTMLLDKTYENEVWYVHHPSIEQAIRRTHDLLAAAEARAEIGLRETREKLRAILNEAGTGNFLSMTEGTGRGGFYPFPYLRWIIFLLRDPFFAPGYRLRILSSLARKYAGLLFRYKLRR